jgi:DNA replication protein DnaC
MTPRPTTTKKTTKTRAKQRSPADPALRERILDHCRILRVPLQAEHLDAVLSRAGREPLGVLGALDALLGELAGQRWERSVERRIRNARFRERRTLEEFDWEFNQKAIDRVQFEELGSADFVRRNDNLILVGQSGLGKSHLIQALGLRACSAGYRVRYVTSAALLEDLTAALADRSLPRVLRRYTRPELLLIDEFGFERVERTEAPQAASLLYKVIDARYRNASTALVTNIDFDAWSSYLGDAPLSMALLDRLVDHAIVIKLKGRSYRAARARRSASTS